MTEEQARRIALLIVDTWPVNVVKPAIWTAAITDCDETAALNTWARLRDSEERAPTVARFLSLYRSIHRPPQTYAPSFDGAIDPRLGKQIAWQAYTDECRSQLRAPNHEWFTNHTEEIGTP